MNAPSSAKRKTVVVVMGVAGTGKSTVGQILASASVGLLRKQTIFTARRTSPRWLLGHRSPMRTDGLGSSPSGVDRRQGRRFGRDMLRAAT